MSADKITPRTDANGVLATIHRDGYWTNTMPAGQDPFPYLSQHGPIEVCLVSELAALREQLAERDAEIAKHRIDVRVVDTEEQAAMKAEIAALKAIADAMVSVYRSAGEPYELDVMLGKICNDYLRAYPEE